METKANNETQIDLDLLRELSQRAIELSTIIHSQTIEINASDINKMEPLSVLKKDYEKIQ